LRAAVALFTREGSASFSARGVAQEAGLSLGSVQHIFPSKDQLLAAMLQSRLSEYDAAQQRYAAELPFNGEQRLIGVLEHYLEDIWQPDTRKFFFNLFALSCHNHFAAHLVNEAYVFHRRLIASYVGAARPALTEPECLNIALQLAALIDGLMIYTAPGSKCVAKKADLTRMVTSTALSMLSATKSVMPVARSQNKRKRSKVKGRAKTVS
jgi:AcrR family transcriptional regulator